MILSVQLDGILQTYTPSEHQPGQDIEHSHHPRRAPCVFSQSITPQIPTLWFLTPWISCVFFRITCKRTWMAGTLCVWCFCSAKCLWDSSTVVWSSTLFLLVVECCSIIWMCHNLFIRSPPHAPPPGAVSKPAFVNTVAVAILVWIFLKTCGFVSLE